MLTGKRIGILGGTFDPVHLGHIALAKAAIAEAELTRIIIMPAYVQPFKQGKSVTDEEHRLAMTRLAFDSVEKAEVSTFETDRMRVSYTYDTLSALKSKYPDCEIFFVTGTDSFVEVDTWYKGVDLLKNFSFIVSVRPGYQEEKLEDKIRKYRHLYGTNVLKVAAVMPDISSTDIRDACRRGESISAMVPEKVERYIKENGLYK